MTTPPDIKAPLLSIKEIAILKLLGQGRSNKEIASILGIAPGTVKKCLSSIFSKLDVHSRTQAVLVGFRCGLLSLEVKEPPDAP